MFSGSIVKLPLFFFAFTTSSVFAAVTDDIQTSKSISYPGSTQPDEALRDALLNQAEINISKAPDERAFRTESLIPAVLIENSIYYQDVISVYDASTELISDFNYDGFYHRFSVAIDVDTIYDTSYIYAELYLSFEGGPWHHYATSDSYHIHGDSELDKIVIETELADGFLPGYYDVRIEIYDADSYNWRTSYGPYDDSSLSALPLEDSYFDATRSSYHVEEVTVTGHGTMSLWLLIVTAAMLLARNLSAPGKLRGNR